MTRTTVTQAAVDAYNVALPQFDSIGATILSAIGSIFIAWLAVRTFAAWAADDNGKMVRNLLVAIVVAFIVFVPTGARDLLVEVANTVTGNGA